MKPHERLGLAIAKAGYTWTPEMCQAWEEVDKQITYSEQIRLIVAAPDLLKVLIKAVDALSGGLWDYGPGQDEHDKCDEIIEECRAAIAKATGETK